MSYKHVVVFFDSKNTAWLWNVYRMERICFQKYFTLIFYTIFTGDKGFLPKWKLSLKWYRIHKNSLCSRSWMYSCWGLCCHSLIWSFDFWKSWKSPCLGSRTHCEASPDCTVQSTRRHLLKKMSDNLYARQSCGNWKRIV